MERRHDQSTLRARHVSYLSVQSPSDEIPVLLLSEYARDISVRTNASPFSSTGTVPTPFEIVVVCTGWRNASSDKRIVGMLRAQRSASVMPVPDTIAPPEY